MFSVGGRRPVVMDGAMGTMLVMARERGEVPGFTVPAQLNVAAPDAVRRIHSCYIRAGADVIRSNTFYMPGGLFDGDVMRQGVRIAREVASESSRTISVAGSITPCGYELTKAAYEAVASAGPDFILAETVSSLESLRTLIAVVRNHGERRLPLVISATVRADGRLPSGDSLEEFAALALKAHPLMMGLNCGCGPEHLAGLAVRLSCVGVPLLLSPSAGLPDERGDYPYTPHMFARAMCDAVRSVPLAMAGGCCGTTPAHIAALSAFSDL